jgi:hypothetical protein
MHGADDAVSRICGIGKRWVKCGSDKLPVNDLVPVFRSKAVFDLTAQAAGRNTPALCFFAVTNRSCHDGAGSLDENAPIFGQITSNSRNFVSYFIVKGY